MSTTGSREAWLWSEFERLYPSLDAGKWDSAPVMADKVRAWLLWHAQGISPDRVLRPEHFEFRGTSPRPASFPAGHSRRVDTLNTGSPADPLEAQRLGAG